MTPSAQRIAIAEACGYDFRQISDTDGDWFHIDGDIATRAYEIPDYLTDLNAMHEAEKVLSNKQLIDYSYRFGKSSSSISENVIAALCTTAAQRAEAFLRTIGKWDETK